MLGALVGAGVSLDALSRELAGLHLDGWALEARGVQRAGFAATKVDVQLSGDATRRTLGEILDLISSADLPNEDIERTQRVFTLLGDAEAAAHGRDAAADQHLHEVGAVDAIIDVTGSVIGLRLLGIEHVSCSALPAGGGTVRSAHGVLPVPPPAVLEIVHRSGLVLGAARPGEPQTELVTPTAAAVLGALASGERPEMRLRRVGLGAGTKDFEGWPNILRLWVGEAAGAALTTRTIAMVETNVDDMLGEQVPFLEERLREAGALDVWWVSVQMKKGRPGLQLTAVAPLAAAEQIAEAMLRHSSTLGVRVSEVLRYEADREVIEVGTPLGPASVKVKRVGEEPDRIAPEYERARELAAEHDMPIAEVYRIVTAAAIQELGESGGSPREP